MKLKHLSAQPWLWAKKHWLISALALLVGSCAFMMRDRTVTWEEEVPLNTGETIWVTRELTYSIQGSHGNPLDLGFRAKSEQTFKFDYGGRRYTYKGEAMIILIAISPKTKIPVLVADPRGKDWQYRNRYSCTTPFYVQFNPNENSTEWIWPKQIEPWLYGIPTNIMLNIPDIDKVKDKYRAIGRKQIDNTFLASYKNYRAIDAQHIDENCFVFK